MFGYAKRPADMDDAERRDMMKHLSQEHARIVIFSFERALTTEENDRLVAIRETFDLDEAFERIHNLYEKALELKRQRDEARAQSAGQ